MTPFWLTALLLQIAGGKMQNIADHEKGPFGLEGDQYWNQPLLQDPATDFGFELVSKGIDGIYIDAPARVYLDKHTSVPLACLRSGSMEKLHKHNFTTTSQLAVTHLETGRIQVIKPAIGVRDPDERPPSEGWTSVGTVVDLAEVMDLGERLGRYAAIILSGPEASNLRIITLFPSKKSAESRETQKQLTDLRAKGSPPLPIMDGGTLELKHETEPISDGSVWNLSIINGLNGKRIRLTYRLEIPPRLIFGNEKPVMDENGKRILASLPLALVGFDEKHELIFLKKVGLPVVNPPSSKSDHPIIQGAVSISLTKLLGNDAPSKKLHLWALALDRYNHLEIPMETR